MTNNLLIFSDSLRVSPSALQLDLQYAGAHRRLQCCVVALGLIGMSFRSTRSNPERGTYIVPPGLGRCGVGQFEGALRDRGGGGGSVALAGDLDGREGEFDAVLIKRLFDHRIGADRSVREPSCPRRGFRPPQVAKSRAVGHATSCSPRWREAEPAPEAATAAVAGLPFAMRSSAAWPRGDPLGCNVIDLFRLVYRINQ
jgi:hypothetical protein